MSKKRLKILHWDIPLDFNKNFYDGYRILGQSTTIGGLVVVIILSVIFYEHPIMGNKDYIIPITTYIGHGLGSFIKRRFGKERGAFLPIVDHGDSVIVSGLVLLVNGYVPISLVLVSLLVSYLLIPLLCIIGFKLGLRDYPY